jgi:hypothetical protein
VSGVSSTPNSPGRISSGYANTPSSLLVSRVFRASRTPRKQRRWASRRSTCQTTGGWLLTMNLTYPGCKSWLASEGQKLTEQWSCARHGTAVPVHSDGNQQACSGSSGEVRGEQDIGSCALFISLCIAAEMASRRSTSTAGFAEGPTSSKRFASARRAWDSAGRSSTA